MTTSKPVAVVGAVIEQHGKFLICQRPAQAYLPGAWEFPGGKIEYGETPEEALKREIDEELNLAVEPMQVVSVSSHVFPEKHIVFIAYRCNVIGGHLDAKEHECTKWVSEKELLEHKLTPGTAAAVQKLLKA